MKKIYTPIAAVILGMTCFSQTANAAPVTEVVSSFNYNGSWLEDVDAYGSTVAWYFWDAINNTTTLYYWDGQSTQVISNDDIAHFSLYNGKIAFATHGSEVNHLKYWDGTYDVAGQPIIVDITSAPNLKWVSLYSGRIAWSASDGSDNEIYYWDGTYNGAQPNITQITDNNEIDDVPDLDDGLLAWRGGPTASTQEVRYWDGISTHALNSNVSGNHDSVSASNGGIAWKGTDGKIYYWDGTYSAGNPDIVAVTGVVSGKPSLYDGTIAYTTADRVYYWDGVTSIPISDTYDDYIDSKFKPAASSGGVAYTWRDAAAGIHEIRFVSFPTQCQ